MKSFEIRTSSRNQFVEITDRVRDAVRQSGIRSGCCVVYCPHTTAGLTINENADPDVVHDMLLYLNRTIPQAQSGFRHGERNSDAHIKASFFGSSVTVIVENGELVLGRWQGIWFCEFDGPRTREFQVQMFRSL
jgi:secondary thiamine-phosphate synthase enzyme